MRIRSKLKLNMYKTKKLLVAALMIAAVTGNAQDVDKKILNWYNGKKFGMSTDAAYAKLLAGKKSEAVVVAVIDSGVDIEHEDLQGSIWVNEDEIPGNGIDDDNNGYIDDVNGWNFLGNADGENINAEQLEVTRQYAALDKKYKGLSKADVSDEDMAEYENYKAYRDEVEGARSRATKSVTQYVGIVDQFKSADAQLKQHFGGDYAAKDLKGVLEDPEVGESATTMYGIKKVGLGVSDVEDQLQGAIDYFQGQLDHHYNPDFNARAVVGDDPSNFEDKNYGNNDVEGPDALHGTHVAGIIAATRGNGIGNDGVADNVKIMSVRAIPDGDERDKDVALAIRYAVDNGAQIINMSFGKAYSPNKAEVIEAIKYAKEKGVLCVHAAGNSSKDIGKESNFPSPKYPSMSKEFSNWIEVGASTRYKKAKADKKNGGFKQPGLAARFSNYNNEMVDVFAPGLEIYSTIPNNEYIAIQGTSMASPMVAGVAALLKSYYPELTMFEIRDIIFESVQTIDRTTPLPGDTVEVPFAELCATDGIVNVYNAVQLAEEKAAGK